MTEIPLAPGDTIHCLDAVTAWGAVWPRGSVITLTADQIAATVNRHGQSWLSDLSEEAQLRRWGRVRLGVGDWPEGEQVLIPGSVEHALARTKAREQAMGAPPRDREAELRRVREEFGTVTTSTTLGGPTDLALAQSAYEERQRVKQAAAEEQTRNARRVDLDALREIDNLMDLARAASFSRGLERQDVLADDAAIRERS
jgi:hypothetical protein